MHFDLYLFHSINNRESKHSRRDSNKNSMYFIVYSAIAFQESVTFGNRKIGFPSSFTRFAIFLPYYAT